MGVRRGTATPSAIYRGTVPVQKVMRGTVEVWSSSPYPLSGTWGPRPFAPYESYIIIEHVVAEAGQFIIDMTAATGQISHIYIGGLIVAQNGRGNPTSWAGAVASGDVIKLTAGGGNVSHSAVSGSWSITKN